MIGRRQKTRLSGSHAVKGASGGTKVECGGLDMLFVVIAEAVAGVVHKIDLRIPQHMRELPVVLYQPLGNLSTSTRVLARKAWLRCKERKLCTCTHPSKHAAHKLSRYSNDCPLHPGPAWLI